MSATLVSPEGSSNARKVRCRYLTTGKRGSVDQCTSEALDPEGELLLCRSHFARALEMAGRLPGISITIGPGGDGR